MTPLDDLALGLAWLFAIFCLVQLFLGRRGPRR